MFNSISFYISPAHSPTPTKQFARVWLHTKDTHSQRDREREREREISVFFSTLLFALHTRAHHDNDCGDDDDDNNDDDLSLRSRRGVYIDRRMSTPATGRATRSHHRSGSPPLMISSCVPHTQTHVSTWSL